MGVDWVPAAPRAGVPLTRLAELADAQASLGRAAGWLPPVAGATTEPDHPPRLRPAAAELTEAADELESLLDFATDAAGVRPSFRVAVIGGNSLVPVEWRDAAWRTLPAAGPARRSRSCPTRHRYRNPGHHPARPPPTGPAPGRTPSPPHWPDT